MLKIHMFIFQVKKSWNIGQRCSKKSEKIQATDEEVALVDVDVAGEVEVVEVVEEERGEVTEEDIMWVEDFFSF